MKGKGDLETWWVKVYVGSACTSNSLGSVAFSEFGADDVLNSLMTNQTSGKAATEEDVAKTRRLVEWNVDILTKILKQMVARRASNPPKRSSAIDVKDTKKNEGPLMDEVIDILALPQFDASTFRNHVDPATVKLSQPVHDQLNLYVTRIASSYRSNPFHSFEHAR